jgi:hypothetical protein
LTQNIEITARDTRIFFMLGTSFRMNPAQAPKRALNRSPDTKAMLGRRHSLALWEPPRKSKGIDLEELNALAAGAVGNAFMQLSAKSAIPNG